MRVRISNDLAVKKVKWYQLVGRLTDVVDEDVST